MTVADWIMVEVHENSSGLVRLRRLKQQQLLRALLERRIDRVDRGLLALAQAFGQLHQVDAAQRVDGDGQLQVGSVAFNTLAGSLTTA